MELVKNEGTAINILGWTVKTWFLLVPVEYKIDRWAQDGLPGSTLVDLDVGGDNSQCTGKICLIQK